MRSIQVEFQEEPLARGSDCPVVCVHELEQDSELKQPGICAALTSEDTVCVYVIFQTDKDYFLYNKSVNWNSWVVLGCGGHVHFVSKKNNELKTHSLGGTASYFQDFYTSEEPGAELADSMLLVASGTGLTLFNLEAEVVWQLKELAVDGVNISEVRNNVIYGSAEQDPPGGWQDFEVSLRNGTIIKEPKYW